MRHGPVVSSWLGGATQQSLSVGNDDDDEGEETHQKQRPREEEETGVLIDPLVDIADRFFHRHGIA